MRNVGYAEEAPEWAYAEAKEEGTIDPDVINDAYAAYMTGYETFTYYL